MHYSVSVLLLINPFRPDLALIRTHLYYSVHSQFSSNPTPFSNPNPLLLGAGGFDYGEVIRAGMFRASEEVRLHRLLWTLPGRFCKQHGCVAFTFLDFEEHQCSPDPQ